MTLQVHNIFTDRPADPAHNDLTVPTNQPAQPGPYARFFKRGFDIFLVVLTAPTWLTLVLMIALVILMTGNKPFYSQLRVGRGGKPFRMWKLRTMVKDADAYLEVYLANNPNARREWDATQKLKNDPRITRVGRVLRKTSLDELPQLFNVLNGTMSLVGPRPMMLDQQQYYNGRAYYRMRPGITGLWQVSDRNNCAFADRAVFDAAYDRIVSLKTDLSLILRTVRVVWFATGH